MTYLEQAFLRENMTVKRIIIIAIVALSACGPAEMTASERTVGERDAKEFMKDLGKCDDCGKRHINLFGGKK